MCVALLVCILLLLNADFTNLNSQASKLALKVPSLPSVCWEHSWENLQPRIYCGDGPDFSPLACVALSPHLASPPLIRFKLLCTAAEQLIHRSSDHHFPFICKVFKTVMSKFHFTFFRFF